MDLSEEAKAEIAAAVKILRDDGVHIHKSYSAFMKSQEPPPEDPKPHEGDPPPAKDPVPPDVKAKKKGLGLWRAEE